MRRPSLSRMLKQQQALLSLGDWKIDAEWADAETIKADVGVEAFGSITYDRECRTAKILLLDPTAYVRTGELVDYSPRRTLLHELLHLYLECADSEREEQAINAIAGAIDSLL